LKPSIEMAFKRTAKAIMSRQNVPFDEWMEVLRGQNEGAVPKDYVHRVAKTVLRRCDPKQYLLSHATIVASVDAFAPPGAKTGRIMNRGVQIDVRWPDYRIKPECQGIVNNNGDAWERSLLLSTYRSFIGAHNYLEHIQIPELSKGFIVDAVARDLGTTCYIDILVATDKKHRQLVTDILSGEITGLSMGCISLFTCCTRCGNVASDDSQLCPCVQYDGKHTEYVGDDGQKYKISELIGHVSVPNSNQFIEASWVKNPAFKGAVRRNFLNGDSQVASRVESAFLENQVKLTVQVPGDIKRAASARFADQGDQGGGQGGVDLSDLDDAGGQDSGGDQGGQDSGGDQGQGQKPESKPAGPKSDSKIDELLDKAQEQVLMMLVDRLGDRMKPKPEDVGSVAPAPLDVAGESSSLVRASDFSRKLRASFPNTPKLVAWAEKAWRTVHVGGVPAVRKASMTPRDLIVLSWIEDRVRGRNYSSRLYGLAMKTGSISSYPSETSFVAACSVAAGRQLSAEEVKFLTWKGRIASIADRSSR
jgi:hypothetical protein